MNNLLKFKVLTITLLIYIALPAQSQNIKFEHISHKDGLSQSSVYSIVQDNKGFMWFATLDGLNKYDGYTITVYRSKNGDPTSISDNVLNCLYVDPEDYGGALWIGTRAEGLCKFDRIHEIFESYGKNSGSHQISNATVTSIAGTESYLWVGTKYGLNRFDRKTNEFKHYFKEQGLAGNIINTLFKDTTGNIWIGTNNGLSKFNVLSKEFKTYLFGNQPGANNINAGFFSEDGFLYLGTDGGLIKLNIQSGVFNIYQCNLDKAGISNNTVTSLVEDKDGIIWIGTERDGLKRFDKRTKTFFTYKHDASIQSSLQTDNILTLYQDKANILWVGNSLGGINKWNRAAEDLSVFRHNPYNNLSLSSNQVRSIYQDKKGRIWIGTIQGGLNQFIAEKNIFKHYKYKPGVPGSLPNNHVRAILEDSKERYWVGTDGGFCRFYPKTGQFYTYKHYDSVPESISDNHIWRIIEDRKGRIWIATFGGGVNIFDPETQKFQTYKNIPGKPESLSHDDVTTIYEDHLGNIWVGTFGGGLNLWDDKTESFKHYEHDIKNSNSLGNNRIYAITEDCGGALWIGTEGTLDYFDRKTNSFVNYDETDGFQNNIVMGVLEDNERNLWISTNSGISKFNPATKEVRNYNISDGLQSNEFLAGSFCKTEKGKLVFGGINGFNDFDPSKIKDNPNKPSVVITGFKVSNAPVKLDSAISEKKLIILDHTQNDISFDFVALDYTFPEKNRYKYRLIGFDKDWIDIKYQRYATYTSLPPGDYVFNVIASNNDEVWNREGAKITVIIKPAIWQRIWFKIASVILLISIVLLVFYLRVRVIQKRNKQLEEQVKLRTAEVVRQRDLIQEQKKEIEDSIVYAKRIQTGTLPLEEYSKQILSEHFVLFKPKDIVSGDFYWTGQKNGKSIVIAADCTGHGVPGAFMSMLGISFLNKIINEKGVTQPDEILNILRENVIKSLHQSKSDKLRDGMDIAVIAIDYKNMKLQYAGANNPLYYITDNKDIKVIRADKMPIGMYEKMDEFTLHELNIKKKDSFYIFSDGYADQFGGPQEKKFNYKPFRQLLLENARQSMEEQKQILDNTFEKWKGNTLQVDDIVVLGVRI